MPEIKKNNEEQLVISPNPTMDRLEIKNEALRRAQGERIKEVKIYDVVGNEVLSSTLRQAQGDKVVVDVSGLKNGMYFVEVTSTSSLSGRKVERTKFVKE